jgi:hypothetical protein
MGTVKVIGIHAIEADEPVHLIEIEVDSSAPFDVDEVTQKVPGQPRNNWQVPYDERELESDGAQRFAFFFHYLDLESPLETPFGPVTLPAPTPFPDHLADIIYEKP